MDMLKKYFPFSFNVKEKDVTSLIVSIIIYVVVMVISGVVMALLSLIPVVNMLVGILGWIVELYAVCGIALGVLNFFNILK